jgi:hypothetical protein
MNNSKPKPRIVYSEFDKHDISGGYIPDGVKKVRILYKDSEEILLKALMNNDYADLETYFDSKNDNPHVLMTFLTNAIDVISGYLHKRTRLEISADTIMCEKVGDSIKLGLLDRGYSRNFEESGRKDAETKAIEALQMVVLDLLMLLKKEHYSLYKFLKQSVHDDNLTFDGFWATARTAQPNFGISEPLNSARNSKVIHPAPPTNHMNGSLDQYPDAILYNKGAPVKVSDISLEAPVDDAEYWQRQSTTKDLLSDFNHKSDSQ